MRPTWEEYFGDLARMAATRSTCTRRKVGAVLVRRNRVIATGYNGPPRGYGHCDEGACPRSLTQGPVSFGYDDCVAIHAEANALLFASEDQRDGATLYTTDAPCFGCAKLIANSGVSTVFVLGGWYEDWPKTLRFLTDCGVAVKP